jgi:hypothetical protein
MPEAVVKISNLDFRFDSNLPFVLRDVSMEVARGRCAENENVERHCPLSPAPLKSSTL